MVSKTLFGIARKIIIILDFYEAKNMVIDEIILTTLPKLSRTLYSRAVQIS